MTPTPQPHPPWSYAKGPPIPLTSSERALLTRWAHSRRLPAGQSRRAAFIVALADGLSVTQAAQRAGLRSRNKAYQWLARFREEGPEGLKNRPTWKAGMIKGEEGIENNGGTT